VNILGIDTALGACSAAVVSGDRVLARAHERMVRGHAEALAPMVESVMRQSQIAFRDLERLAVTTGPGTFTGQRVGLAFVRALAVALKRPAVGVTTLEAMAAEALAEEGAGWAAVVLDAKREEIYFGAERATGALLHPPALLPRAEALAVIAALTAKEGTVPLLVGSGAIVLRPWLEERGLSPRLSAVEQPDAVFVARRAAHAPHPHQPPHPLYLRATDAKLPASP
jgi:tRNA threonylcarbamoyladenosine biosynthesis protein TsaB